MTLRRSALLSAGLLLSVCDGAIFARAADIDQARTDLWTGFYLGGQLGHLDGSGGDTKLCNSSEGFGSDCLGWSEGIDVGENAAHGMTAGGYLGFNYRFSSVVLGLEGDFNWDDAHGRNSLGGDLNYDTGLNWDASARARLGYVIGERAIAYVTGGPNWINAQVDSDKFCATTFSVRVNCGDANTEFGWQLGIGAEFLISDHLSLKTEYLHGWYGAADLDLASTKIDGIEEKSYLKQSLQTDVVRAGIAYHFGGF